MTSDPHKLQMLELCRVEGEGMNGKFLIPFRDERGVQHRLGCLASDQFGWEHVSVTNQTTKRSQLLCPSWEMMCRIKRAFWEDEETVVEYHVPMSEWINDHPGCLHLWRPTGQEIPRPPALFVGVKL